MTSHMKMPMKMVECDCGFMVRDPMENELVQMVQMHFTNTHKKTSSRDDVMRMMKPASR